MATFWLMWKLPELATLDSKRKISSKKVWSLLHHDLPPNARALRKLRGAWRRLWRRGS